MWTLSYKSSVAASNALYYHMLKNTDQWPVCLIVLDSSSPDYHKSVCAQELTSLSSEVFHSKLWYVPNLTFILFISLN